MLKRLFLAALAAACITLPADATLTTTTSVAQYTSNGVTTVYSFPYRFLDNSYLVVTKTDLSSVTTTLVLGTDYTVTGANLTAGGSVTLTAAIPNNWILKIKRSTPKTQTCNFRTQGTFQPKALEDCLDRAEMQIQEMNDGTFTQLIATPITTAQATVAAPSTVPNSSNTNVTGSSSAFAAADHLHALAVGPMLDATSSAGQSIANGAVVIVVFGTVNRDTDSAYNAGTGRYTVPTGKGGDYTAVCSISYVNAQTGLTEVFLEKNAAIVRTYHLTSPTAQTSLSVSAILNLAAGDVVDCRTAQPAGSPQSLNATAALTYFALKRIQ